VPKLFVPGSILVLTLGRDSFGSLVGRLLAAIRVHSISAWALCAIAGAMLSTKIKHFVYRNWVEIHGHAFHIEGNNLCC
jgi:hypothetical protein